MDTEYENGVEVTAEAAQMNSDQNLDLKLGKDSQDDVSVDGIAEMGDVTNGIAHANLNGNENETGLDSSLVADKQDNTSEPYAENNQTAESDVCSDNPNDANVSSQFTDDDHHAPNDGCPQESILTEASEHSTSLQTTNADVVSPQITEVSNQEAVDENSGEVNLNCSDQNHLKELENSTELDENNRPVSAVNISEQESEAVCSSLTVKTETITTVHISSSNENGEVVTQEDEEGAENVILSDDEARLLEKLKYQPFDVAQVSEELY